MSSSHLGVFLEALPLSLVREFARRADQRGFVHIWIPEITFSDAFVPATAALLETGRARLATGVVGIWSRSPVTMALTVASLNQLAEGRVILGLGLQARPYVEDWHGARYHKTVTAMREYVTILRRILAGGSVTFEGEIFRVKNFQLHMPPPQKPVPIYIAAIGPKMLQLAGELADGALGYFYSVPYVEKFVIPNLRIGAARAERSLERDGFELACGLPSIVTDDDSGVEKVKAQIVMFATAGGSSPFYAESISSAGYGDALARIQERVARKDLRGALGAVSDEMASAFTISGTPEHARNRIEEYQRAGVRTVVLNPSPPDVCFPLYQGHFPEGMELPAFSMPDYVRVIEKTIGNMGRSG